MRLTTSLDSIAWALRKIQFTSNQHAYVVEDIINSSTFTQVPQEELLKKRSTELLTTEKPQTTRSDILIKDLKQPVRKFYTTT